MEVSAADSASVRRVRTQPEFPAMGGFSTMPRSPRFGRRAQARRFTAPGPGAYGSKFGTIAERSKAVPGVPPGRGFGTASTGRFGTRATAPGQGSPEMRQSPRDVGAGGGGPSFSVTPRRGAGEVQGPGPGEYNHKDLLAERASAWPGVKQSGFGGSPRPVRDGQSHEPWRQETRPDAGERGPGTYMLKDLVGSGGPGFSATPRREEASRAGPGPGEYNHRSHVGENGVFVPERQRGFGGSARPVRDGQRHEPWRQERSADAPERGPGTYNLKGLFGNGGSHGPGFSATPRREEALRAAPGPGEYNHKGLIGGGDNSVPLKQRGFGGSARPVRDGESHEQWRQDTSPDRLERGPGTYNLRGLIGSGGPLFSATPRRSPTDRSRSSETPGPGDYEHAREDLFSASARAASLPGTRGFGGSARPVEDGVRAERRPGRPTGPAPGDYGRSGDSETLGEEAPKLFPEEMQQLQVEADVGGAHFGSQHVPKEADDELGREVHRLSGVCWFSCGGAVTLPEGPWRISFRVKRLQGMRIGTTVIMKLNDQEVKRTDLEDELEEDQRWTLLEAGVWSGGGEVAVKMHGQDCADGGQGSKRGLLIDRIVATAA